MPADVRVHTLRLHRPLPALGRSPQAWAEDALRCASLPSRWQHRWVLVRRLQLRLGARADASTLSRHLSARWAELAASAEPGESASPQASAVWFADEPAARLAWLHARLQGQPCQAWFWAQVLPTGLGGSPPLGAVWPAQTPWRTAVPPAREAAFQVQAEALLIAALGPSAGEGLGAPQTALAPARPAPHGHKPYPAAASLHAQPSEAAARTLTQAPVPSPGQQGVASETVTARQAASSAHLPPAPPAADNPASTPPQSEPEATTAQRAAAAAAGQGAALPASLAPQPQPKTPALTPAQPQPDALPAPMPLLHPALLDPGLRSAWGGFLFVLALWRSTPLPDGDTAVAWLRALAAWLRVPADDGVAQWLASLPAAHSCGVLLAPPLRAWRLQALRLTRLPLRRLAAGPALLRANATHVDVHLPLRGVRLAVRRAGLDLDPGWQPVLGRAVHFHYEAR